MERSAVVDRRPEKDGESGAAPAHGQPARRTGRTALAVAAGLLIGLAAAFLAPRLFDGSGSADGDARQTLAEARVEADTSAADAGPTPAGAGATSPEAAVTGFLDAEADRDFATSFGFLSAEDRRLYATPAGWVGRHADVLGPVLGYEVLEVGQGAEVTEVVTEVRFTPGLDQVVGLTPAEAVVTWTVILEPDGAWGIDLEESAIAPVLPPDEGAATGARAWADARRACTTPANERPALVGSPALAEALCGADEADLGPVEPLDAADAQPIARAYGPTAASAARIVRLTGPAQIGVVLIPLGETWTVIAVVP